ncbi:MAG TPA: GAF domain-containing sensor histidine kinase [Dehalococcoidia bacterium]|nr:GAF domain-containing sensor histidine kinase [Dehalococcoidia bacterium]
MPMFSLKVSPISKVLSNPRFWVVLVMFIIGIICYYPERILGISSPSIFSFWDLTRHTLERLYFLLPITYAGFTFRIGGGLAALAAALAIMLPRAISISTSPPDALFEVGGIIVVGGLVNVWFESYRREQGRRQKAMQDLEKTKQELQASLDLIRNTARRLSAINSVSEVVSQSLELGELLNVAADTVCEVTGLDVALLFLLDDRTSELNLRAFRGVADSFVDGLKGLKVGEGFNGQVAKTGEPLQIANSAQDPRLTRDVVRQEGIQAQLIVPLKAKDKVVGTLTVAGRQSRQFEEDEVELLTIIGRQVGVAIENSRMYQVERSMARQEKQVQRTLRFYLRQVTRAQEEERRRIAQELHDDTTQGLVILLHEIDELVSNSSHFTKEDTMRLEEIRQRISQISDGVRRFSQDLRPSLLDDLGLLPALEWLTSDLSNLSGIEIEMNVLGLVYRFPPETELVLFRIVQEALRNMWKHSHATRAWVTVEFKDDTVTITIKDDGIGFELPGRIEDLAVAGKLGLAGMQERAQLIGARLRIQSEPGMGTTVTTELPIQSSYSPSIPADI